MHSGYKDPEGKFFLLTTESWNRRDTFEEHESCQAQKSRVDEIKPSADKARLVSTWLNTTITDTQRAPKNPQATLSEPKAASRIVVDARRSTYHLGR